MTVEKQTLTEEEAATYIGFSRSFLAQARCHGDLPNRTPGPPFVRISRTIRYLLSDLDEWLEQNKVGSFKC